LKKKIKYYTLRTQKLYSLTQAKPLLESDCSCTTRPLSLIEINNKIMNTHIKTSRKNATKILNIIGLLLLTMFVSPHIYGQVKTNSLVKQDVNTRTIKGVINDSSGILPGANILLKGTNIGTSSDINGEFTFPRTLKVGDILSVSYLGYTTQYVKIKKDINVMNIILTVNPLNMVGDLAVDTPYKSKRSK